MSIIPTAPWTFFQLPSLRFTYPEFVDQQDIFLLLSDDPWRVPYTSSVCCDQTDPTPAQKHWHGTEGTVQEASLVQ